MTTPADLTRQAADAEDDLRIAQARHDRAAHQGEDEDSLTILQAEVNKAQRAAVAAREQLLSQGDEPAPPSPPPPSAPEPAPATLFHSAEEFLTHYLLPIWRRPTSAMRWCDRWWLHAEAVTTIEALWRSWEELRLSGATGMAVWLRDYLNPLMRTLTDSEGTFAECNYRAGKHELQPLAATKPEPQIRTETGVALPPMEEGHTD